MDGDRNSEGAGGAGRETSGTGGVRPGMREFEMEDYGHDDSDPSLTGVEGPVTTAGQPEEAQHSNVGGTRTGESEGKGGVEERALRGGFSGGREGTHEGSHEGERFGEFERTDTGTDLTVEFDEAGEGEGNGEEGDGSEEMRPGG